MIFNYHSSPAWSIPARKKKDTPEESPAPTSYFQTEKISRTTPFWKIGTSNRGKLSLLEQSNPGPGSYQLKRNNSQGIKFTKHQRKTEFENSIPGPGTYTINNQKKLKRGYYMAKKYDIQQNKQNPGPGAYKGTSKSTLRKDFGKMGNAQRLVYKVSGVPGPGSYMNQRCQSAGPRLSFSRQKRMKLKIFNNNIGPGKYQIQSTLKTEPAPGYSMCGKHQVHDKEQTPGPSTYHPKDVTKSNNRSVIIAERLSTDNRPKTPGPGEYLYQNRISFVQDIRHGKFNKEIRSSVFQFPDSPGPTDYQVHMKPNMPSSPKYTLKGNRQTIHVCNVPGPSDYHPSYDNIKIRPLSAKIGSSLRKQTKSQITPGPGHYKHKGMLDGPSWGFGTSEKVSGELNQTPGPNYYKLKSTISDIPSYYQTK